MCVYVKRAVLKICFISIKLHKMTHFFSKLHCIVLEMTYLT